MDSITRFDGTFELVFLSNAEKVRSDGHEGIEIIDLDDRTLARASVGDIIVRDDDGSLRVIREVAEVVYEEAASPENYEIGSWMEKEQ